MILRRVSAMLEAAKSQFKIGKRIYKTNNTKVKLPVSGNFMGWCVIS